MGVRIAAFSSGPIKRDGGGKVLLVGVIAKQGKAEGIISGKIRTDGDDSTEMILKLILKSRFKDQVKLVALNGVALAGLNIVDLKRLKENGYEYVVLTRYKQRPTLLIRAIRLNSKNVQKELLAKGQALVEQKKVDNFYIRTSVAVPKQMVQEIYEALRLSHMISNGISTGESKGRI